MIGSSYSGAQTITIRVKGDKVEYCANEAHLNDIDGHIVSFGVCDLADGAELVIVKKDGLLELQERASVQPAGDE